MQKVLKFGISFALSLAVLLAVAYYVLSQPLAGRAPNAIEEYVIITTDEGQQHRFDVELALTLEQVRQGLMHRESLDKDAGMLFLFGANEPRSFWMKNTLIPLDIIFINEDGSIRHIHRNATPLDETPIESTGPVLAVLEIPGGVTAELGIEKGDVVHHSEFGNRIKLDK